MAEGLDSTTRTTLAKIKETGESKKQQKIKGRREEGFSKEDQMTLLKMKEEENDNNNSRMQKERRLEDFSKVNRVTLQRIKAEGRSKNILKMRKRKQVDSIRSEPIWNRTSVAENVNSRQSKNPTRNLEMSNSSSNLKILKSRTCHQPNANKYNLPIALNLTRLDRCSDLADRNSFRMNLESVVADLTCNKSSRR